MRTIRLKLDANGRVRSSEGGYVLILQALSAGDNVDVVWLDQGGLERGRVLDVATGQRFKPGFPFGGFQLEGGTADASVDVLVGDNPAADADILDAVTVENPSSDPVQVEIVEPIELTASSVSITANAVEVSDAAPFPVKLQSPDPLPVVEELPAAITNVAPVAVDDDPLVALLAASAARRGFYARNVGADAVALVGAGGTFANAAIVIQPGETWAETNAPGAAWFAICDAGLNTTVNLLMW